MSEFLAEINWSPLWISLKTGFAATVIAFFLGIFFARLVMKMKPVSRGILDGILTMPLVLPPTVAGFILLLLFKCSARISIHQRKHSWQDQNRFRCHCFGDCGRKLWHGRFLGSCDLDHFICDRCGDQYRFR